MTLEFENAIAIQPLEGSGSGLQFQNIIYIQPESEGGDTPVVEDIGTMYQQTSSDGTTWSTFSKMTSNTVAGLANLRPFGTGNRALENYWDYTGKLTLTLTFTYANSVDATWYNNPFTIYYTKNGHLYYSGIHVEDNKISLSHVDAISKNLTAGHTYSIKLCLNAETNKAEFYFKEIGVDNSYTFVEARDTGSTYSGAMSYIILGNNLIGQNPTAYHHFADFDLSDIIIDVNGTIIFSRVKSGGGGSTLDKMYQSASADGTTWDDFSEMTTNTVAEFAQLRPFKPDDTGLEGLLTGSEKLALTLTFKYTADLSSSLIVLVGMSITDGDTTYNEGVMISGNALQFSFKGSSSTKMKAVRTDSTYAMKLVFDNSTKNYSLYYKEIGKDNDFVLLNTTLNSKTASSVQNYIQLQNSRSVNGTYTRVAEFDLTDITIDIDGEVIFSRT